MPVESKISKMLSDKTIKIIIMTVLSLVFILPLITVEFWTDTYL
jgi:hypothetical protein